MFASRVTQSKLTREGLLKIVIVIRLIIICDKRRWNRLIEQNTGIVTWTILRFLEKFTVVYEKSCLLRQI